MMEKTVYPMPICKVCNKTIDISEPFKTIHLQNEIIFAHEHCKTEPEKSSEFIKDVLAGRIEVDEWLKKQIHHQFELIDGKIVWKNKNKM